MRRCKSSRDQSVGLLVHYSSVSLCAQTDTHLQLWLTSNRLGGIYSILLMRFWTEQKNQNNQIKSTLFSADPPRSVQKCLIIALTWDAMYAGYYPSRHHKFTNILTFITYSWVMSFIYCNLRCDFICHLLCKILAPPHRRWTQTQSNTDPEENNLQNVQIQVVSSFIIIG